MGRIGGIRGFGSEVYRVSRKVEKEQIKRRKRREEQAIASREDTQAHEMALERTRGGYGLEERGMAELGSMAREQLRYGPGSIAERQFQQDKRWRGVETGLKARERVGGEQWTSVNVPTPGEITETAPGIMNLQTGEMKRGVEKESTPYSPEAYEDWKNNLETGNKKKKKKSSWDEYDF